MTHLSEQHVHERRWPIIMGPRSQYLLGMKLTPMTVGALFTTLEEHIAERQQCVIAYQNLHGMHLSYTKDQLVALHRRANTYVYIDGFPVYLMCRLFGAPAQRRHRITGNDYIWSLLELAQRNRWKVYFLGSTEEIVAAATVTIRRRMRTLSFRAHHGFFNATDESDAVLSDINAFQPDLLVVCMGMPRQEEWILNNAARLNTTSVCAMGAILDYVSGFSRIPPRWLGPIGLEWLFRLIEDPERFGHRYLLEPWMLLANIIRFPSGKSR